MVFFGNCYCYLNLVFYVFFRTKKILEPNLFSLFLSIEISFKKHESNMPLMFFFCYEKTPRTKKTLNLEIKNNF